MKLSEDTAAERQIVACGGKAPYANPPAAQRRAKIMRRTHDKRFVAYRCKFCRRWHIGSREAWQSEAR